MAYRKVYFHISSSYAWGQGWASDEEQAAFRQECRSLFTDAGWTVEPGERDCVCDTVRKGPQELYLHPMSFEGVIEESEVAEVEVLIGRAATFRLHSTNLHEEYLDLSDDDYWMCLLRRQEEIEAAILERHKTKRRNLYITEGQALNIAQKFTVHRLCDKKGHCNKANLFVSTLIDKMLTDGRLVVAQTRQGMGVRTATKKEMAAARRAASEEKTA